MPDSSLSQFVRAFGRGLKDTIVETSSRVGKDVREIITSNKSDGQVLATAALVGTVVVAAPLVCTLVGAVTMMNAALRSAPEGTPETNPNVGPDPAPAAP